MAAFSTLALQLRTLLWKHFRRLRRCSGVLKFIVGAVFAATLCAVFLRLLINAAPTDQTPACDYTSVPLLSGPPSITLPSLLQISPSGSGQTYYCANTLASSAEASSSASTSGGGGLTASQVQQTFCTKSPQQSLGSLHPLTLILVGTVYYVPQNSSHFLAPLITQLNGYYVALQNYTQTMQTANSAMSAELQALTSCFVNTSQRILGFDSVQDAINAALTQSGSTTIPWGIVQFAQTNSTLAYTLTTHTGSRQSTPILWLQDLVENSVVQARANGLLPSLNSIAASHKLLPAQCEPNVSAYSFVGGLLSLIVAIAYFLQTSTLVGEMVVEKTTGMREYLQITCGVSGWLLKTSWILYGAIVFAPIPLVMFLALRGLPQGMLSTVSSGVLLYILFFHAIAQLGFAMLLAAVIPKPTWTSTIVVLVALVGYLVTSQVAIPDPFVQKTVMPVVLQNPSSSAFKMRLMSLDAGGAAILAFWYALAIEAQQRFFVSTPPNRTLNMQDMSVSPLVGDKYGAVGEAVGWIMFDTLVYFVLAWYFENVLPREYGQRRAAYFFVQPSYWHSLCGCRRSTNATVGVDSTDSSGGISIKLLSKSYESRKLCCGKATRKFAVNNLTAEFQPGQITSLLGQNGAGKTTTMRVLTGMLEATSGSVRIDGYDVRVDMAEIRKRLAFCPQHDTLFPELTVRDHIRFFAKLKGVKTADPVEYAALFLRTMDIDGEAVLNTLAGKLSGGQQRKLSICLAYLAPAEAPKTVVILDEPTSAIDPFSRRKIWDLILRFRATTTTLISTHYMQEADVLSDQITIISKGQSIASGSPMTLKGKYGNGFRLTIAHKKDNTNLDQILQFVKKNGVAEALVTKRQTVESEIAIPHDLVMSPRFVRFLTAFENSLNELDIVAYGLSEATLDQVFFKIVDGETASLTEATDLAKIQDGSATAPLNDDPLDVALKTRRRKGILLLLQQFYATLVKRFQLMRRSWIGLIFQLLMPLGAAALMLAVVQLSATASTDAATLETLSLWTATGAYLPTDYSLFYTSASSGDTWLAAFVQSVWSNGPHNLNVVCTSGSSVAFGARCSQLDGAYAVQNYTSNSSIGNLSAYGVANAFTCTCGKLCPQVPSTPNIYPLISGDSLLNMNNYNVTDWLLKMAAQPIGAADGRLNNVVGGVQFSVTTMPSPHFSSIENVTIWSGDQLPTALTTDPFPYMKQAVLNVYNNALLSAAAAANPAAPSGFSAIVASGQEAHLISSELSKSQYVLSANVAFFVTFGLSLATYPQLLVLVPERSSNNKQLQFLFGLRKPIYWAANLIWDFAIYTVSFGIIAVFLKGFQSQFNYLSIPVYCLIACMYGVNMIGLNYVLSFVFAQSRSAILAVGTVEFISMCSALVINAFQTYTWFASVDQALCFIPMYFCTDSLFNMLVYQLTNPPVVNASTLAAYAGGDLSALYTPPTSAFLAWDVLGKRFAVAVFFMCVVFFILALVEFILPWFRQCCCGWGRTKGVVEPEKLDPDVRTEREKVLSSSGTNADGEGYRLEVRDVVRVYSRTRLTAVKGVSFGVKKGECFGLLGVNGAGKTSLFRIISGFQRPTRGTIRVLDGADDQRLSLTYCPQEDVLFETLTVVEHLELYARIRGWTSRARRLLIENVLAKIDGLRRFRVYTAKKLSGGNRRKLCFALAVLDCPPLICVDEPTTGMDPQARKTAWRCLDEASRRGSAIVITSHSMEECEQLCSRLAIMVSGQLRCIGSVQYLKEKLGNAYSLKFRLTNVATESAAAKICAWFATRFSVELVEQHSGYMQLKVCQQLTSPSDSDSATASLNVDAVTVIDNAGDERSLLRPLRLDGLFTAVHECIETFNSHEMALPLIRDFSVSQTTLEHVFVSISQS